MPKQTSKVARIFYPDGCKVEVKKSGGSYTDLGYILSSVTNTLNWDESQVETANAGKLAKHIRNMTMSGGFTLGDLDPAGVALLGGGIFETVVTAGSTVSSGIADQVIASGWTDKSVIPLVLNDGSEHKLTAAPVIASVDGSINADLVANDDYTIVPDSNSGSGYSIVLNTAGTKLSSTSQSITIEFTSFIPIASTTIYGGTTSLTLEAYALRFTHTDSNAKIRQLELFSVNTASGGFVFNFMGANEEGIENMPLTFTADIDTTLTDGRQLFSWTVEDGAE